MTNFTYSWWYGQKLWKNYPPYCQRTVYQKNMAAHYRPLATFSVTLKLNQKFNSYYTSTSTFKLMWNYFDLFRHLLWLRKGVLRLVRRTRRYQSWLETEDRGRSNKRNNAQTEWHFQKNKYWLINAEKNHFSQLLEILKLLSQSKFWMGYFTRVNSMNWTFVRICVYVGHL